MRLPNIVCVIVITSLSKIQWYKDYLDLEKEGGEWQGSLFRLEAKLNERSKMRNSGPHWERERDWDSLFVSMFDQERERVNDVCVRESVYAAWPDGFYSFHYLSIYNHEKLPNFIQNLLKSVAIFAKYWITDWTLPTCVSKWQQNLFDFCNHKCRYITPKQESKTQVDINYVPKSCSKNGPRQCDQIRQFIGLCAIFQSHWKQ